MIDMNLPSIIAATTARPPRPCMAAGAAGALLLSGCMGLMASRHTYQVSSPAVTVNGAEIRMQVKPEGTDGGSYAVSAMVVGAAVATFDGPFRWRIEATGRTGEHESIVVHRIHTRTASTGRDEWYPSEHLGKRADFTATRDDPASSRARYPVPGLLVVKPREDGELQITVDLSVRTVARTERRLVRFLMDPSQQRQDEFIFLPAEIVRGIGQSPADWDDPGWN